MTDSRAVYVPMVHTHTVRLPWAFACLHFRLGENGWLVSEHYAEGWPGPWTSADSWMLAHNGPWRD